MKRILGLLVLSLFVLSVIKSSAQSSSKTTSENTIKSFITKMYNEGQYEDYAFLQKYCSHELLQKLQEAYPYDTNGVAYATWLFRSGMQDAKPESDEKTTMLDIKNKGDWYTYTALDMGWKFTNSIKVIIKDNKIVIIDMLVTQ